MMRLKQTYSSREVTGLTGLSARQLQLWDASGLMAPSIPPRRTAAGGYTERRYTPIELLELFVLSDLRARGFTIQQLHTLVRSLADHFAVGLYEATGGGGKITLLTDGSDIYARTESGEFYNVLKAPTQPLLVLGTAGEGALLKTLGKLKESRSRTRKSGKPVRGRRPAVE
jgi:DNA-binding transcriptional MerR regulator